MRLNLPVSNVEFILPDGAVIVTKTDLKGTITYCNQAFVEVSGRSRDEIIGAPHNIVRHPDMPPEAFADLWKTIKANKPWQGVVKNRRKDGSFYWAVSNITPLMEKGEAVGYVAFRYKATQEQIDTASAAYRAIREGSSRLRIEEGQIVRIKHPLLHWLSAASVKARLFALIFVLLGALVATGIYNLYAASEAHQHTMEGFAHASVQAYALDTARKAESAFKEQRYAWQESLIHGNDAASLKRHFGEFNQWADEVDTVLVGQLVPIMQQIGMPVGEVESLLKQHVMLTDKCRSMLAISNGRLGNAAVLDGQIDEIDQRIAAQFNTILAGIREAQLHGLGELNETMEGAYLAQRDHSAVLLGAFSVGGLILSIWFIAGILRPIRRASGTLDRVIQLQQQFLEKILVLEEYRDRIDEEQRIGGYIVGHLTNVRGVLDPLIKHLIRPAAHLSGDMLLAARTPDDTLHVMLADAVGHGLVAAVNVLPLSQAFYEMSEKGFHIAQIAEELNLKIYRFMPVDRFVAVTLISVNVRNRVIEVWNGGNPAPVLLDGKGEVLHEWKSIHLPPGILPEENFSNRPEAFQYDEDCQLCLFSDGLPEAESPQGEPFGREQILALLKTASPEVRFDNLVGLLDQHLAGRAAHDDISLAMINVPIYSKAGPVVASHHPSQPGQAGGSNWKITISLGAAELKYLSIVPMLTDIIEKIRVTSEFAAPLFMILSELFNNALDHGILRLDSGIKHGVDGFDKFLRMREERLASLENGKIDIEIEKMVIEGNHAVRIRVADSGGGFDFRSVLDDAESRIKLGQHGRGIALVESIAHKLEYVGSGNEVVVYYICA